MELQLSLKYLQSPCRRSGEKKGRKGMPSWLRGWVWACVTLRASAAQLPSQAPPPTSFSRVKWTSETSIQSNKFTGLKTAHPTSTPFINIFSSKGSSLKMETWSTLPAGLDFVFPTWCLCWQYPGSGFSSCFLASSKTKQYIYIDKY